ncbi:MAG: insulinase family protein [Minisyncoccia bacterium]
MESSTKNHTTFEESTIIRNDERLATLALSIPLQESHTAFTEALILIYGEALSAGAGTLTRDQFLDAESKLGSQIHINGDSKHIHITLSSLDTSLLPTLALLELMLMKPTFAQSEIKRIKELLINSLILSKEDARSRAYEGFVNALTSVEDKRYMFSIDTLIENIKKITTKDLKKFHSTLWHSKWIFTAAGSRASTQKISSNLKKLRGTAEKKADTTSSAIPFKNQTKRTIVLLDIPHKQNIEFSIGNTLLLRQNDPEYAAFVFGMSVLALYGGFSGRLMSTVREKEGLTYSIYGQAEKVTKKEQGFWRIATFFSPKDAEKGIEATLREIKLICEKGITENELKRFKAIINTRSALVNDSLLKKVREIQGLRENDISDSEYEDFKAKLQKMTLKEVHLALSNHINLKTLVISGAGPVKEVKKQIEGFAK